MTANRSDVVIVGAGIAGLVLAYECLEKGSTAQILERGSGAEFGGLARLACGGMALVDTPLQRRAGIRDSAELAMGDWESFAEFSDADTWPRRWAEHYVSEVSPRVYHWLHDHGLRFLPAVNWAERGLYRRGNSVPRYHVLWGTGQGLVERFRELLEQHPNSGNLRLAFNTRVDDLIVSITGDIDGGVIEDLARRYVGTLPAGTDDTFADTRPTMLAGIEGRDVALPEGTANGGIEMLWSSEQDWTDSTATVALVLETIINTRIAETVREELGASYGGFASISLTTVPDTRIDGYIAIDGDPSRLDEIRATVLRELAELALVGPTADELGRAVSIISSNYDFVDNFLFISENLELERNPDTDIITTSRRSNLLDDVSASDVRSLAGVVFTPDRYLEVTRTGG